jgi:hypothetical protein
MTGAVAALASNGGLEVGGGGIVAPATLSWNDIFGEDSGSTQILPITETTTPIQVAASKTGGAQLAYILNGTYAAYSGWLTVHPNDTLGWSATSTSTADQSGVITVTNVTNSTTLDTFNYTVYSSRGVRL